MIRRIRGRRPSPAMVVASLALAVALGGTTYAAIKLPKNSVGSSQLKRNSVTGAKVRDFSLFANDFAAGQIPQGPRGPAGPRGSSAVLGTPEAWKPLPFATGWGNYGFGYGAGEYRKDQLGEVHLRGLVHSTSGVPTTNQPVANLPPSYRPAHPFVFVVQMGEPGGVGRVDVGPDGTVAWLSGVPGGGYLSLTGIEFSTD